MILFNSGQLHFFGHIQINYSISETSSTEIKLNFYESKGQMFHVLRKKSRQINQDEKCNRPGLHRANMHVFS
ncbi:hypothetical protein C1646_682733, partial [Rhizophagus diaphanus]